MRRPLCVIGLSLALGTWIAFFFPAERSLLLSAAAAATGLLLALVYWLRPSGRMQALCAACLTVTVALALHTLHEVRAVEPFLRARAQTVTAEGLITGARRGSRTIYYELDARFPGRDDLPDAPMTLRCYGEMEYTPGDAIRFEARLTPVEPPEWGLRPSGETVLEAVLTGTPQRLEGGYAFRRGLLRLRERLQGNVYEHLRPATAEIVAAMVLGRKAEVSAEAYAALNRAGTSHLLSVSGLHLSILTALVMGALERLRLPRPLRAALTIAAAFAFAMLVGFSASILRSFLMTAIALAAGSSRRGDPLSSLGFAVCVICLVWPHWVLGRGFWLSAGSTLGILLYAARLRGWLYARLTGEGRLYNRVVGALVGAGAVSVAAYAFTLPLLVLFGGWISIIAPLANILAGPFVPVVIVGGIVCAVVPVGSVPVEIIARLTDLCAAAVLRVSQIMGDLPFATAALDQGWMLLWVALVIGCMAVLIAFRADRRLAACGAALLVMAFCVGDVTHTAADRGKVELVTIADCDTALLLQDGEAVLLGTPAYYETNALLRYMQYRGVRRIRAVVAADCGEQIGSGLLRVAERYAVDCVVGPDDAYILGQLAAALPEIPVYSGGYATLTVFGGVRITLTLPDGDIAVTAEQNTILKSLEEYAIIQESDDGGAYTVRLYPDGKLVLRGARGLDANPVGSALYGEVRLVFF